MTRKRALAYARTYRNVTPACRRFIYRAALCDLVVTSTTGGQHSRRSFHYQRWRGMGRAVDVASPEDTRAKRYAAERRFYIQEVKREGRLRGTQYLELFGPGKSYVKDGRRRWGQFPFHEDHIHGVPKGVL